MTVFGTVHAPLFHPLIAAKEFATADHIGEGRVGVNIVVGWNEGEFDMFGVKQREHDARYDYGRNGSMWSSWPGRATARSISTAAICSSKAPAPIQNHMAIPGRCS